MLASGSPQRRELLQAIGEPFEIRVADVDETPPPGPLADAVRAIARRKAAAVAALGVVGTLLAADTVIDLDGRLLGKPIDGADAARMLAALSGRTHAVHTGVALLHPQSGESLDGVATSTVRFRPLTAREIDDYLASGEPFGKAGAYAIQGQAQHFATTVEGAVDNVIGLPMRLVRELLATLASRLQPRRPRQPPSPR